MYTTKPLHIQGLVQQLAERQRRTTLYTSCALRSPHSLAIAHRHTPVCLSCVVELFSQSSYMYTTKPLHNRGLFNNWRRGRDSNSGRGRPLDGFQDRCIKPLCHLSIFFLRDKDLQKTVIKLRFIRRLEAQLANSMEFSRSPIFACATIPRPL